MNTVSIGRWSFVLIAVERVEFISIKSKHVTDTHTYIRSTQKHLHSLKLQRAKKVADIVA